MSKDPIVAQKKKRSYS